MYIYATVMFHRKIFPEENFHSRAFCGALAVSTEAIFIAPFEVIKICGFIY